MTKIEKTYKVAEQLSKAGFTVTQITKGNEINHAEVMIQIADCSEGRRVFAVQIANDEDVYLCEYTIIGGMPAYYIELNTMEEIINFLKAQK